MLFDPCAWVHDKCKLNHLEWLCKFILTVGGNATIQVNEQQEDIDLARIVGMDQDKVAIVKYNVLLCDLSTSGMDY